jgi:hypothetical protein
LPSGSPAPRPTALDWRAAIIYLCIGVSLAFVDHRVRREMHRDHVVTEYIPSVLAGTSGAPAKYRVLMPYALDALQRRTGGDPYMLVLGSELLFILASLVTMHVYLRLWFDPAAALGGTLALAAFLPLTFTNSWIHPDTFPDLFLFTAGCLAVAARRDLLLAVILVAGMFNRETIGFVALLWALNRWSDWRRPGTLVAGAGIVGVSALVYAGLRVARGFEHYEMWMVPKNLSYQQVLPPGFDPFTRVFGFFWLPLVAVPLWLAWSGARREGAPAYFRHAVMVAALFAVVVWLFAAIIETRVFTPLAPLLLPGAVAAFTRPADRA